MNRPYEQELMRLLCQLAMADGEVVGVEADAIFERARAAQVDEATVVAQEACLRETPHALPAPDFAVLRTRVADTLLAARTLLALDGVLADGEVQALHRLESDLGR